MLRPQAYIPAQFPILKARSKEGRLSKISHRKATRKEGRILSIGFRKATSKEGRSSNIDHHKAASKEGWLSNDGFCLSSVEMFN